METRYPVSTWLILCFFQEPYKGLPHLVLFELQCLYSESINAGYKIITLMITV